jgi:long-chain acyl-CoA synthetase
VSTIQLDVVREASENCVTGEWTNLFERLRFIASADRGAKVAISDDRSTLTYAELVDSSAAFCAQLQDVGIQPLDPVGVVLGNCREFLIAAFGIFKHGAVLVPLNPQLREAELLKTAEDCQLRALVTATRNSGVAQALIDQPGPAEHAWLCSSESDQWQYRSSSGKLPRRVTKRSIDMPAMPQWPAIIQYSTGSMGYPKRVTRTHAQLIGEFAAVSNVLQTTPQDRILGVAQFFHSHGLMNSAMQALLAGATLHIVSSFLPRDMARLIERERITIFPGVPFMFDLLAELPERHDFSSVRLVISAGAPLSQKTEREFAEKYAVRIRQLYGTTETGAISIQVGSSNESAPSAGTPIAGVSVRILDDQNNPVAAGITGRVEITNPYAACAYDNTSGNEESHFAGSALFPGDIGRVSPSGELALCGRHRGFINVGGNKVDPSEIERVLRDLPGVTEAVVFGVSDGHAGEKIKAVLASPSDISRMAVRSHCVRHLAEFKQPKVIEIRKELPKSPLGKVLRKYLMDEAAGGRPGYVFDPLSGCRLTPDSAAAGDDPLRLATLPPFLRVLLVTDGTVTKCIEAYFLEPVEVDVLVHAYLTSEREYPVIGVVPGDPILRRCVVLRGQITRSAYAFAESIMACDRVPADMKRKLIEGAKGIGELLRESKKETYRELLRVRQADAGEWAMHLGVEKETGVLIRDYKIHLDGQAAMEIEEVFPLSRFN